MATRNPSLNIRPDVAQRAGKKLKTTSSEDHLIGPRPDSWWTGKHPTQCPGYDAKHKVLKPLPLPCTSNFTRQSVLDYFDNTWTQTEVLFAALQGREAFLRPPYHQLRHPLIFYYNHPAVLYINKLLVAGILEEGIDQFFEQLFETGVDEMSWDDLSQKTEDWPSIESVTEYRRKAYSIIKNVIEEHPCLDKPRIGWDDAAWAIFMGFEHERIHLETSSVLIRELPLDLLAKPDFWPDYHPTAHLPSPAAPSEGKDFPANELIRVPGEQVVLGKSFDYPSFGWDNEYGSRPVSVQTFRASKFKVTNGEFWRFVKAGGYSNPKYWSTEGWAWKTFRNIKWPTFWIPNGPQGLHKYKLRVLFDAVDMRWDWPVDANYHEAKAYCAWKAEQDRSPVMYRVITEAEQMLLRNDSERVDYHRILGAQGSGHASGNGCAMNGAAYANGNGCANGHANGHANGNGYANGHQGQGHKAHIDLASDPERNVDVALLASGHDAASKHGFNFQLAHGSQNPVTELPPSHKGFHDVMGNVWEWGEDHFAAFHGFKVHPVYEDFSAPCFAGKHQMIIGGSFISTGQLASKHARYQFRPHFFQHAGFRVVVPEVDLSQYDMTRYGPEAPVVPFVETSCMDSAPPHVGEGPCCSVSRRRPGVTATIQEEAASMAAKNKSAQALYEDDALLAQVLATHYGPASRVAAPLMGQSGLLQASLGFYTSCAQDAATWCARVGHSPARALDLGCSVGRAAFELTRHFEAVVGVDLCTRVIEVANKIKENGKFDYDHKIEGDICERLAATVDSQSGVQPKRAKFVVGNACELPKDCAGSFDCVLAANVIDRVPDPLRVLQQAHAALSPGGVLLLTSPFGWSDEFVEKANWLGGYFKDGAPVRSADNLTGVLKSLGFELLSQEACTPLLIPDHDRKFQLLLPHKIVAKRL